MRNAIVAALVLSPLMVHAQAKMPAQTQATVLQASVIAPTGLMFGAAAEDRPTVKTSAVRISTGVVEPKLIHTVAIREAVAAGKLSASDREVVVAMVVDEKGKPSDLKILESPNAALNESVLDAVKDYRFTPGSVSGLVAAVPVNLHITIKGQE